LRTALQQLLHAMPPKNGYSSAMRPSILLALGCLAISVLPSSAQTAQPAATAAASPATSAAPAAAQPIPDPAAYVAQQFGTSFTVDSKIPPLFGDLDGDGNEDVVLVATSATPLLSE